MESPYKQLKTNLVSVSKRISNLKKEQEELQDALIAKAIQEGHVPQHGDKVKIIYTDSDRKEDIAFVNRVNVDHLGYFKYTFRKVNQSGSMCVTPFRPPVGVKYKVEKLETTNGN